MLDYTRLRSILAEIGVKSWLAGLQPLLEQRLTASAHGDFEKWRQAVDELRNSSEEAERKAALLKLSPWRKGPFDVAGVRVDAEWRSDMKWDRLKDAITPLDGRAVLDVGCGNGFYVLRMQEAGARAVLGIDPTLLYVIQFLAVTFDRRTMPAAVLPLRLHELPRDSRAFDTTFSMGVLYHQRSPIEHLRQLRATLRHRGQLVLETLFVPGEESYACTPQERYARMKNVWLLPTLAELTTWLKRTGYRDIEIVDQSITSTDEQRATEWMTFESLAEALDPGDPAKTVEGWPAPRRVIVTATAP